MKDCRSAAGIRSTLAGNSTTASPAWSTSTPNSGVGGHDHIPRFGQVRPGQPGQHDPVDPPVTAAGPAQHLGHPEDIMMAVMAHRDTTQPGAWADYQPTGFHQRANRLR